MGGAPPDGALRPLGRAGRGEPRRHPRRHGRERLDGARVRVTRDVFAARDDLVAQGFDPVAMSVPAGDYGRLATNDPRLAPYVRSLIGAQFGVGFVRDERNYPAYTTPGGAPERFELGHTTTADDLY